MATSKNTETVFKCCTCAEKNTTKEADKYCTECQDYFCSPCIDLHNMFPSMRGHKLLDKTEFSQAAERTANLCSPTDRCPLHRTRLLDMWCKKHDAIVCATCIVLNHSSCVDIHCIPEEIDQLYEKSTIDDVKQRLPVAITAMKDIKKAKVDLVAELKKCKKNASDSIRKFRKDMEAEFKAEMEKLEKESIEEVEAEYDKIAPRLDKDTKEVEAHINELEQSSDKLKHSGGNKTQEFICVKEAEKNISNANEKMQYLKQQLDVEITFLPDSETKNISKQLKKFGKVPQLNPKVTMQKDVDVKLTDDTNACNIWGSCFTNDGLLLLADYSNRKLKRVNVSTCSVEDHLSLEDGCYAVCLTIKDEAAVALYSKCTIQFVSLGNKMATTKQLKLGHHCFGIAYKDARLFTSDASSAIYIDDMNGTMLRKITTDRSGSQIFRGSRNICLNSNRDKLYVADSSIKGVVTLDIQGNYESTFTDPDLGQAYGVCTDGRGNMFVCDHGHSNIIQVNEQSRKKIGVLGKVKYGYSVCFDSKRNKLVVTLDNSNTIRIFDLKY